MLRYWLIFIVLVGAVIIYLLLFPVGKGKRVELIIEPGTSLKNVATLLQQSRVVYSSNALIIWMKLRGLERRVQAGRGVFFERQGILATVQSLLNTSSPDIVVTIPEGLTIEQTANRIFNIIPIDTSEFISLCYDSSFAAALGVDSRSLEGYLFPDTYRFLENTPVRDIIKRMVDRFHFKYSQLVSDSVVISNLSRNDIVILASIIEKEATVAHERPRISGVFHLRLSLGMSLGADPTVRYAIRKFTGPLFVSELNTPSPYNTRRYTGLPPGPICSPGFESLKAALFPLQTDELYFVAKEDGSGEHDFSKTNAEHVKKKRLAAKRRALRQSMNQ